ncbi:MAG: hypothetical protein HY332_15320 [Chloroflexi bacterium]|nr:hypothetical protein [Chloroflexota bacterium]
MVEDAEASAPPGRMVPSDDMQAVPLGFFLFLAELAAGGILVTVILDWEGEVSPGFLLLNGLFLLAFAAAALWLRSVLPAASLLDYDVPAPLLLAERILWSTFAVLTAIQLILLRTERRVTARVAGTLAAAAGIGTLGLSAAAYGPPDVPLPLVMASLGTGALALGTVWTGMMLGHWYLVTPLLSTRPLLWLNGALAAVLLAQGLVLIVPALLGDFAATVAWLFWLRTAVGIVFPLVLSLMIWRTARVRRMMSATGLLYIALGAILSGQIIAKALFFVAGMPV